LAVHARPANGTFEPTIPALALHESRVTLGLDRGASLTYGGFELGAHLSVSAIRRANTAGSQPGDFLRPSATFDVEKPFGTSRLLFHTIAAGIFSGDTLPAQHLVHLGGPTSGPGYDFHEFVGRGGVSQRIEYRFLAPFVGIPLGRFGHAPATITLAPFATAVWIDRSTSFKFPRQGWHPSVGLGALTVFDLLRLDVARGLRDGRWTFSVDVGRDFWSVL
jgi:hemolysin activation/secretion protein